MVLPLPSARLFAIRLFAQSEALNQRLIPLHVFASQIGQMAATLAHKLQQTSAGMLIMFVGLQVLDQLIDAFGQQGHLHFGRAGVVFV